MAAGWTTPCGGNWWDKNHSYIPTIADELFLSVAEHLANRSARKARYLSRAQREWAFLQSIGMINSQNTINDGVNTPTCTSDNGTVWSYNQSVIDGRPVELNLAASDNNLLPLAQEIATAAVASLNDSSSILHDPCEPSCGADGAQFKGIFMRNLHIFQPVSPNVVLAAMIQTNADSIWASDRDPKGELSVVWSGPFIPPANACT